MKTPAPGIMTDRERFVATFRENLLPLGRLRQRLALALGEEFYKEVNVQLPSGILGASAAYRWLTDETESLDKDAKRILANRAEFDALVIDLWLRFQCRPRQQRANHE